MVCLLYKANKTFQVVIDCSFLFVIFAMLNNK